MAKISKTHHITKTGKIKKNPVRSPLDALDKIRIEWYQLSRDIHIKKFGKYVDYNAVVGAGVVISKNNKVITKWHNSGMYGESEALKILEPKIKKLGYDSWYNPGRLD